MIPEEIEPRVSAVFRLLQHEIDQTALCPRTTSALDRALLMVTSKALRLGLAVCNLSAAGFYGEAFGLTRSVLEAFFIVKFISSKDAEDRASSYLEYRKTYFYNQEEIRKKHFPHVPRPEWLTQQMLDEVKRKFPNTRHWVSAYNMASEYYDHPLEINPKTGKGFQALSDYDGIYEMTSHYVHVTAISSMANYYASPFRTAKRDKEEDRGILALHFSLVYVYETCILLGRQWDCALPTNVDQIIQTLLADLRNASSVQERGVWAVGP
jgi:Family of unknown function (DUF5677)